MEVLYAGSIATEKTHRSAVPDLSLYCFHMSLDSKM